MTSKSIFYFGMLCWWPLAALSAQDVYFSQLFQTFTDEYQLPAGSWISYDTESANIAAAGYYGDIEVSSSDITGQDFSKRVRIKVNNVGGDPWASAWSIRNPKAITKGHRLVWVIWLRSTGGEKGKVNLFAEDVVSYEKEVIYTLPIEQEWTQLMVPFEAADHYPVNDLNFGLHLGLQAQTLELGGFAIIDFGTSVSLEQLPEKTGNERYGGYEADAPWRATAAARIEELRKADLSILVSNQAGEPVQGATVQLRMVQHEFGFGTAVVACRFPGNNCQNNTYLSKLTDLDGQGHGFNEVVLENALKWPGWENNWNGTKMQKAGAVRWLRDRDIQVRGHNLVWPGADNLPDDINANISNINYIKNRIDEHLQEILSYDGIQGNLLDWDVLNEITTNRTLEEAFRGKTGYATGRELYAEIFGNAKALAPEAIMYINDYITISQDRSSGETYDQYQSFIREMLDAGAPVEGIGFQAHIGGFPTSINTVYDILEDFYQEFGLEAKVTEFDISSQVNDELAAKYLKDFLTMTFSHPSMKAFLMWGFWDGNHWRSNAPLFYQDWTLKPAGQTFVDLVFNEWWTEETLITDENGKADVTGFKGIYEISYTQNGEERRDTIALSEDVTLQLQTEMTTGIGSLSELVEVHLFPNPVSDRLLIRRNSYGPVQLRIIDLSGRPVMETHFTAEKAEIPINFPPGLYLLHWQEAGRLYWQKLVVQY